MESNGKRDAMTESPNTRKTETELKCPTCHYALKRRRGRQTDACEMLCGGCGRVFDVCDLDTLEEIEEHSS
jgi:peptide subunit release factor 1 (eRF1)